LEKQWRDTQAKENEKESEKESENKLIPYDWKSASTTKMNWSNTKQTSFSFSKNGGNVGIF